MTPRDDIGNKALAVIAKANAFNKWMYEAIQKYTHGNILEIGSGIGNISQFFIKNNHPISLSDIDPYYLTILKEKFIQNENIKEFLQIDLQKTSFSNAYHELKEKYDTVFMLNVLEHLKDDTYALENCKFLLKPGGTLIILVPAYKWLFSEMDKELGHYRRYTSNTINHLTQKVHLKEKKTFYFNSLGIAAWFYGKLLKLKIVPEKEMSFFNKIVSLAKLTDRIVLNRAGLSVISVTEKQIQ